MFCFHLSTYFFSCWYSVFSLFFQSSKNLTLIFLRFSFSFFLSILLFSAQFAFHFFVFILTLLQFFCFFFAFLKVYGCRVSFSKQSFLKVWIWEKRIEKNYISLSCLLLFESVDGKSVRKTQYVCNTRNFFKIFKTQFQYLQEAVYMYALL